MYNPKCATDQTQRHAVQQSAGEYTGLFYPHLRATELGMRVERVLNTDGLNLALRSPWPHPGDDRGIYDVQSRHGVKQSAGPYTGPFYPHLRATELGMRV